jgi:hypothetical protein
MKRRYSDITHSRNAALALVSQEPCPVEEGLHGLSDRMVTRANRLSCGDNDYVEPVPGVCT